MWYLVLYGILAIWAFVDAKKRKANAILWAVGTLLLGPIILPFYFAKRPLKAGEVREGGTAWNVLKNFAFLWTILMVVAAIWYMVVVSEHSSTFQSGAERAGAVIGTAIGLGMIAALWFFPFIGAVVLGLILKKSSILEKGPSGALTTISVQDEPSNVPSKKAIGWAGWIGIGFVGILILGIIGSFPNKSSDIKESTLRPSTPSSQTKTQTKIKGDLEVVDFDWKVGEYGTKYLVGTVKNNSDKQYSCVTVEFNLYDESGAQVDSTFAIVNNLEPYGTWKFEAMVIKDKATRAKLKGVRGF